VHAQIFMTYPSFDRSWLYKELNKFYMRERDINRHYLTAVLQVFSNNADLARFLPPICHQVPLGFIWFFTPNGWYRMSNRFNQISDGDIVWYYRFCMKFVAFLLSNAGSMLISKSLQAWLSGIYMNRNYFCEKLWEGNYIWYNEKKIYFFVYNYIYLDMKYFLSGIEKKQ